MKNIIKRDGTIVPFNKDKIINAINKAFIEVDGQLYEDDTARDIADEIYDAAKNNITVEEIQDMVEDALMRSERKDVAKAYIKYRERRTYARGDITDKPFIELLSISNL